MKMSPNMESWIWSLQRNPDFTYVRDFHPRTLKALEKRKLVRRLLNGRVILTASGKRLHQELPK